MTIETSPALIGADRGASGNWSGEDEQQVRERIDRLISRHDPRATPPEEFWGRQFDAGLAWINFPVGHGGLGLAPGLQAIVNDRLAEENVSRLNIARNVIGHGMGAPTVVAHGSVEQMERWLRPMFTGEERWCQLFS
jgi:alkylation response protein AidB-like acyl-CoA dehydrogenase